MTALTEQSTVAEAKDFVREHADEGTTCPVCTQRAQVYRRTITGKMAAFLIELSRTKGDAEGWVYIPAMKHAQGDSVKLRYWGLVEGQIGLRDDGSDRVGYWRITQAGKDFVRDSTVTVPKHARVYDGRLLNLDESKGRVSILDCLGKRFDYGALMQGLA